MHNSRTANLRGIYEIEEIEDRWYEPNLEYFRVRTTERHRHSMEFDVS
jgi:hypothetical protein